MLPRSTSLSTRTSPPRSEEHTSELQSRLHLVCRPPLEKKTGRPKAFGSVVLLDATGGQQSKDVFRSTDGGATFAFASKAPTFDGTVAFVTATRWLQVAT